MKANELEVGEIVRNVATRPIVFRYLTVVSTTPCAWKLCPIIECLTVRDAIGTVGQISALLVSRDLGEGVSWES